MRRENVLTRLSPGKIVSQTLIIFVIFPFIKSVLVASFVAVVVVVHWCHSVVFVCLRYRSSIFLKALARMNSSAALKRINDERLWRLIALGSASALTASAADCRVSESKASPTTTDLLSEKSPHFPIFLSGKSQFSSSIPISECEFVDDSKQPSPSNARRPSWMRRALAYVHLKSLPIPRQLLANGDPIFRMDPRLLQKRQDDEGKMQNLIRGALQERDPDTLKALNQQCLELAYGEDVTLKSRQDFVHVSVIAVVKYLFLRFHKRCYIFVVD